MQLGFPIRQLIPKYRGKSMKKHIRYSGLIIATLFVGQTTAQTTNSMLNEILQGAQTEIGRSQ
jgi:hypothetical protein